MRSIHTLMSAGALIALAPADDSGSVGELRRQIVISGETFSVKAPYAEGHVLNAAEASVLNQTYSENVRNNVAGKIKAAKEAHLKVEGNTEDNFSLDTVTVPGETEGETVTLRESLTEYADSYEFGMRVTRSQEPVDPVQREARVIAREMLNAKLKAAGGKKKDVDDSVYEEALKVLAARDDVQKEATRRVKQRESIGGQELDLESLLGSAASEGEATSAEA